MWYLTREISTGTDLVFKGREKYLGGIGIHVMML